MKYVQKGDKGPAVVRLQRLLLAAGFPLEADGDFGKKTKRALIRYEESKGFYGDGILDTEVWNELLKLEDVLPSERWARVDCDKVGKHYAYLHVRTKVAKMLREVVEIFHAFGAQFTTSGGKRKLSAKKSANRAVLSMHKTGDAFDFGLYTAGVDLDTDPLLVEQDTGRLWRVYARCEAGLTLEGVGILQKAAKEKFGVDVRISEAVKAHTYKHRASVETGLFIDVTSLLEQYGFERIKARQSWTDGYKAGKRKNDGGWEWWHFQYTGDYVVGETTFRDVLLKLYTPAQIVGTDVEAKQHYVWTDKGYFGRP